MDLASLLPSAALTIVFLLILPQGEKVWVKIETNLSLIFALVCIFAPGPFLQQQVIYFA